MTDGPTPTDLGLPGDRAFLDLETGGLRAPGATLSFVAGLTAGVAAPHRRFRWELLAEDTILERADASARTISARTPVVLCVRLPSHAPARYTLRLEIAPREDAPITFTWTIVVPEQRLSAHVDCHPSRARRGDEVAATLHNEGSAALSTGMAFGLERHDGERWIAIDPFDGEMGAWPAIGLVVPPGGTLDGRFTVPYRTSPGRHRYVKQASAEEAGIADAAVSGEFTVIE